MDKNLRLSIILQAAGNVVGFLKGVKGESARTSLELNATREKLQALQRTTKDVGAFRQMEARLQGTRGALADAQIEAKRLALANAAAERPTKQLARAFEVARTKVRELQTQEQKQVTTLQDLRGKLEMAGVSTRNLAGHEVRLARETRDANNALTDQVRRMEQVYERQRRMANARGRYDSTQQFASSAQGAGASAVGAGVTAGAPLFMAGREGVNFEDAMLDVKKVVDFKTPQQFTEMRADVLDLSIALNLPAEGMAAIFAAAGQAKIVRGELKGFATDAGMMGVAFNSTAEDAGKTMATWRTAFGLTQPEVRGLADQINYLGDHGNATALQITDVVTRVGPLAGVAGAAASEVAALGSTMVAMGVQEEIAATGIKNTMLALTKGTAATKAQRTAFSALGLDAEKVSKAMQLDAGGTIVDVMERVSKLRPDQQTAILTQLFGSESVAAIAPMLSQLDTLKTNLKAVGDSSLYAGSMQKEFTNRQSGAKTAVEQLFRAVKVVGIEVGTAFLPEIKAGSAALKGLAGGIREFAVAHPGAIKVAGMLLAVVAGGLLIFGGLAMAVAAVLGPFALLQLTLTQTGILFGPLGGKIAQFAGKALPLIGRGLLLAGRGFLTFGAIAARAGLMLLANPITWIVLGIVAAVALLAGAAYLIYRNWGTIGPWLSGIWQSIETGVSNALGFMGRLFMNFSPVGLLIGAVMRAWPALEALGGRFLEMGRHLLTGLVNGVLGGIPALVAAVMRAGGAVVTAFKKKLGIHSPSRVFAQLGDYTMQGLGVGLGRSARDPLRRMRTAASAITAAGAMAIGTAAMAAPTFDTAPTLGARPASAATAAQPPVTIGTLNLQIVQRPGEDMEALARRVAELLKNPTGGASFSDDDDSYGEAP
ncbi:MAG: phage tail tape measure protein [Brevundimonas sp.]|uniref:phage tail tape measure protein n=1 Tax=Brevundimonas sp. TaxID=1871086 RepID=UPI0027277FE7|nr:phage tail tape measure protein [Brevundimonas sp.]MDO9607210.1 phage tail tape measure protein [Brevundimonas sp.]